MKTKKAPEQTAAAFTLIELMIVVLIIGILAAMILPVLANAQVKARLAYCLNSQKQFAAGFHMYAADNQERVIGMGDSDRSRDWRLRPTAAINAELAAWGKAEDNQSANQLADQYGYKVGQLYPYVRNTDIIHCPADRRFHLPQYFAYTSYSGSGGIARSATKTSDIKRPAERFLWIEENDPREVTVSFGGSTFTIGENLGAWDLNANAAWWDAPAVFHGSSGTLSFADGHAENKRWLDECTRVLAGFVQSDNRASLAQKVTMSADGVQKEIGCGSAAGSPRDLSWLKLRYDGKQVDPNNPVAW